MAFDTIRVVFTNEKKENLGAVSFAASLFMDSGRAVSHDQRTRSRGFGGKAALLGLLLPIERVRDHKSHNAKVEQLCVP